MNIAVFIKEIPLSNNVQIDPVTHNLVRSGEQGRINPYDVHAIEAALALKETYGGTVSLVTMGPPSFMQSLREGLAMGCDQAYLLSSRAFAGSDTLATAYTLAQAVRKIKDIDLLFFGLKAIDADTGQVGPLVAEELGLPQTTQVTAILGADQDKQTIDLKRRTDTEIETIRTAYPLVITADDSLNQPRYIVPQRIKQAMAAEITVWDEKDLETDPERIGMQGSPTIVSGIFLPEAEGRQARMLEGTPAEAAEALIRTLTEKHLIEGGK